MALTVRLAPALLTPTPQLEAELVELSHSVVALAGGSASAASSAAGPAESGVIGSADDIVLELGTPRPGAGGATAAGGSGAAAGASEVRLLPCVGWVAMLLAHARSCLLLRAIAQHSRYRLATTFAGFCRGTARAGRPDGAAGGRSAQPGGPAAADPAAAGEPQAGSHATSLCGAGAAAVSRGMDSRQLGQQ